MIKVVMMTTTKMMVLMSRVKVWYFTLLLPEAKTKTNRKLTKVKSPHSKSLIMMMVTTALVNIPKIILMVMMSSYSRKAS